MSIEEFGAPTTARRRRRARNATAQKVSPNSPDHAAARAPDGQAERVAATIEHAGVGIIEVDAAGAILRANAQACAFVGAAPADLLGRSILEAAYTDDATADLAQFRRQTAGEIDRYVIDKHIRRQDGSYFWASI